MYCTLNGDRGHIQISSAFQIQALKFGPFSCRCSKNTADSYAQSIICCANGAAVTQMQIQIAFRADTWRVSSGAFRSCDAFQIKGTGFQAVPFGGPGIHQIYLSLCDLRIDSVQYILGRITGLGQPRYRIVLQLGFLTLQTSYLIVLSIYFALFGIDRRLGIIAGSCQLIYNCW